MAMTPPAPRPVLDAVFRWVAAGSVFGILFVAVLRLAPEPASALDLAIGRTGGERLHVALGLGQARYPLETARTGPAIDLALFEGRVVFVNFWATWCPPCLTELPSLLDLASARAAEGLVIVAVSSDDSWDAIEAFVQSLGPGKIPKNFRIVRDPSPPADRDLKSRFGTRKLPESYLVRNGVVEVKYVNARDWTDPDVLATIDLLSR